MPKETPQTENSKLSNKELIKEGLKLLEDINQGLLENGNYKQALTEIVLNPNIFPENRGRFGGFAFEVGFSAPKPHIFINSKVSRDEFGNGFNFDFYYGKIDGKIIDQKPVFNCGIYVRYATKQIFNNINEDMMPRYIDFRGKPNGASINSVTRRVRDGHEKDEVDYGTRAVVDEIRKVLTETGIIKRKSQSSS
jgi:hypothetical protein